MRGLDRQVEIRQEMTPQQSKLEKDVEDILRHVHSLNIRSTVLESRQEVKNEWQQVALVIDRILFIFFLFTFLMYTVILLS